MDRQLLASYFERLLEELTPAGKGQTGRVTKTEPWEGSAMAVEPKEKPADMVIKPTDLAKLRTFFLEKLTVKELRHLLTTLHESQDVGPMVKAEEACPPHMSIQEMALLGFGETMAVVKEAISGERVPATSDTLATPPNS